jgi:DNA-binding LacI/PurR family transcriptional regulator
MKDVTIADVANPADVSKSTGSVVLNDRDGVEDSTWKRILNAILKPSTIDLGA